MPKRTIALTALLALALVACSDPGTDTVGATGAPTGSQGSAAAGGALGSCLAFSVDALAEREWAFDGTVAEIAPPQTPEDPYQVVFDVATWYRGGPGSQFTVETYDVSGTSLTGALALEEGQRVLASGDEAYLWGCGFSITYSDEGANLFAETFGA